MNKVITDPHSSNKLWNELIEKEYANQDKLAWKKLMKTKEGRWIFERILEKTAYRANVFTGNSFTFYNEGRRSVGVEVNQWLVDLLDMEGVELRQKAEREHIAFRNEQWRLFNDNEDEN